MKNRTLRNVLTVLIPLACFLALPPVTLTKEIKQEWEILNPDGVIKIEAMKVNPHPSRLEGKTIMLRWNGKHNGDKFLERVGELLKERVKDVKVVKSWEVAPETVDPITGNQERSQEFAKAIAKFKPDLVIGAQSD